MLDYDKIKSLVIDYDVSEIEFRFDFKSGVNKHKFDVLRHYLDKNVESVRQELSTMSYGNYIKRSTVGGGISFFEKTYVDKYYDKDYDVDVVIINVRDVGDESNNYENIRDKIKDIYSFNIGRAIYDVELSEIVENQGENKKYEIEVKYRHNDFLNISEYDVKIINKVMYEMLLVMNETEVLYTKYMRDKFVEDYKKLEIKKVECNFVRLEDAGMKYVQSLKAKGKKRMLVLHESGVWLVKEPFVYNLLVDTNFDNVLYSYHMSVFEGVIVKAKGYDEYDFNYKYWFICYDCVVIRGRNIQCISFEKRLDEMKEFNKRVGFFMDENYFKFGMQTIRYSDTPDKFYQNVRELLELREEVNYDSDGIVFTPIERCERFKWVDAKIVTTNFVLYGDSLYVEGKKFNEVSLYQEEVYQEKVVVECVYDNVMKKMVVVRVRKDAYESDELEKVLDNWRYIKEPITINMIKGDSLEFVDIFVDKEFKELVDYDEREKVVLDGLSEYWENEAKLNTLVDYIKSKGRVYFKALDGEAVSHLFTDDVDSISISDVVIENNRDRSVNVNGKREYLVFLNDLTQKLKRYGFKLKRIEHVVNNNVLTTEGNVYAGLYVYGYYTK